MAKKKNEGFTLIELLVVIAIIGLLASIVLVSLNSVRGKARNVRRSADLKQIQTAVELYADDHNGQYFSTGGVRRCLGIPSTETCWNGFIGNDTLNTALAPYLSVIPKDPLYGSRSYGTYLYQAPGNYWLPAPINTVSGSYSLALAPEASPNSDTDCLGWKWAAWDDPFHCLPWCRQCGYLAP